MQEHKLGQKWSMLNTRVPGFGSVRHWSADLHLSGLWAFELWKDQGALDAHAKLQAQRPPLPEGLRLGAGEREDYTYNRTR
jgi:hypothetical protein